MVQLEWKRWKRTCFFDLLTAYIICLHGAQQFDSVVSVRQKSVTLTGPSPAMWAPTSRTRQSKTLWPGSKPDKSEESRLFLLRSPPSLAAVPETLIPPWPERSEVKSTPSLFFPPFFANLLDISCGCVEINHLPLLIDMWWLCEMIIFDKRLNWSQRHNHLPELVIPWGGGSNKSLNRTLSHVLRSETHRREDEFSKRHVDGTFTSDVNKVLDSMAAKEYLLWVMTSKPSGER